MVGTRRIQHFSLEARSEKVYISEHCSRTGVNPVDFSCPNCKSTDLRKLSLAYQEGISQINARTRLRGVVVGSDGPDLVVGSGKTKGIQQTAASKTAGPPIKWSYVKLAGWSVLLFVAIGWIVFYANTVTTNSQTVASVPLVVYAIVAGCIVISLFAGFWRHNHATYPRQYAKWDRSFVCNRCGRISEQ